MTSRTSLPLSAYDPLLGPTYTHSRGTTRQRVLAVLVKGLADNLTPRLVGAWLTSRGDTSTQRFVASYSFRECVSAARRHLRQPVPPAGGARALVGHLLAPSTGVARTRAITSRRMLCAIGLGVVENLQARQMETWMTTSSRLAVALGQTPETVGLQARQIESLGWATRRRVIHRGPTIWALKPLRPVEREAAERLHDVVAALAEGEEHATVDLIRLATHPAVSYGDLGAAWLVAVADSCDVDPATIGIGVGTVRKVRKRWAELVGGDDVVRDALDAYDREHGCTIERDRREAERVHAAAESERARIAHREAMAVIDGLLANLPAPGDRATELAWFRIIDGRGPAVSGTVSDRARRDIEKQARERIQTRMTKAGFRESQAANVAARIVPERTEEVAS